MAVNVNHFNAVGVLANDTSMCGLAHAIGGGLEGRPRQSRIPPFNCGNEEPYVWEKWANLILRLIMITHWCRSRVPAYSRLTSGPCLGGRADLPT